ncbi:MAG: peptide chain release factor N(5)-glutamine methyltransferase [Calditrichaeota bacterium]|nr:MAG: peptide chain release factor N(5)-glutamine methyltransferase [Calditrichota bacterium]
MNDLWTIKRALEWTVQYFQKNDVPEPRLSAELLLAGVLGCRRIDLYLQFERILTPGERAAYREYIKRRLRREPVQYILGEAEFYGLSLKVTPAVLIPRPETELLVEKALEEARRFGTRPLRILDVGTGSGCIIVALGKHLPEAELWAVDSSAAALEVARENALRHQLEVHFLEGRFEAVAPDLPAPFQLIVSNPPYISEQEKALLQPEVVQFEPAEALFAAPDALAAYRNWLPAFRKLLDEQGTILVETAYNQSDVVCQLFTEFQFQTTVVKDYQDYGRIVIARRAPAVVPKQNTIQ